MPGEEKIRCVTLMQSTYDYDGKVLTGSAKKGLTTYDVSVDGETLRITMGSG